MTEKGLARRQEPGALLQPPLCLRCGQRVGFAQERCPRCELPAGGWVAGEGQPPTELARRVHLAGSVAWLLGGAAVCTWFLLGGSKLLAVRFLLGVAGAVIALKGLAGLWRSAVVREYRGAEGTPFEGHRATLWRMGPVRATGSALVLSAVRDAPLAEVAAPLAFAQWMTHAPNLKKRIRGARSLNDLHLAVAAALASALRSGAIELRLLEAMHWFWLSGAYHKSTGTLQRLLLARAPGSAPPEDWLARKLWSALPERTMRFETASEGAAPYRAGTVQGPAREEAACYLTLAGCVAAMLPPRGQGKRWLRAVLTAEAERCKAPREEALREALAQHAEWSAAGVRLAHVVASEVGSALKQRKAAFGLPPGAAALLEGR